MKIKKTSPGTEELYRPVRLTFVFNVPVEVPDDIGQALVKKHDFVEIQENLISFDEVRSKHKKARRKY